MIALDYDDLPGGCNMIIRIMRDFDTVCLWLCATQVNRTSNFAKRRFAVLSASARSA